MILLDFFDSQIVWFVLSIVFLVYAFDTLRQWYRLSHIPSVSLLAGFSYLWIAKVTYSGKQYWVHRDLNNKYGPLVRIGPNEVLTDDPEIVKRVSGTKSLYAKSSWYKTGRFNPYHDNLFTILEPDVHKKAKAKSSAAYSGRETPGIELGINEQVVNIMNILHDRYARPVDGKDQALVNLSSISCYFTMDVITRLAFGKEVGCLETDTDQYNFLGLVQRLWPQMSTCADVPWIRKILFSPIFLSLVGPKKTDKTGFGALMGVASKYVNERFDSMEDKEGDMLGSLMRHGFERQECEAEALLMLLAGTESTACAIRAVLVHLLSSPMVYAKLKEEIQLAVKENRISFPISLDEAKRLPYLQAVIFEGIRMRPPLLGLLPKIVPAPGDTLYDKFLPAGTAVCVNTSSLLRSPALFGQDVDLFKPERFMVLDEQRRSEMERCVELAFGYGQWACAGKSIAMMEINKIVFEFMRAFEIQLAHPLKPRPVHSYGVFLEPGIFIQLQEKPDTIVA